MRFFNTAGPVDCKKHYCLAPIQRFNLAEILSLIDQEKYFVLHAPRQTGKTSSLLALMKHLNDEGSHACLYINVETGQAAREDVGRAARSILSELGSRARIYLKDDYPDEIWPDCLERSGPDGAINEVLTRWSEHLEKPLVLLIDEIDSLVGDTLISVLRQIRAGYDKKPEHFPQSIVLCGVRDVRDYRIHSSREKTVVTGGSAFNVKAKSLRVGNFSRNDVHDLLRQHVDETGQQFAPESEELVWEYTRGQPWLVNALAYETTFEMKPGRDREKPITADMMVQAKENLVLRRETHIDQLADKLQEERVRRVVGPMLQGGSLENIGQDDIQYLLDLGLIHRSASGLEIANGIYREVIPRELTLITQYNLEPLYRESRFVLADGRLDADELLSEFQQFFRENSEIWLERFDYREAAPQLLLQAFLQRIVNSGGQIHREYGLGRKRTDLMVLWKHEKGVQKIVMELKILYKSLERTVEEGCAQLADYREAAPQLLLQAFLQRIVNSGGQICWFTASTASAENART